MNQCRRDGTALCLLLVLAATTSCGSSSRSGALDSLDGDDVRFCTPVHEDGTVTIEISRVRNAGTEAAVAVESVELVALEGDAHVLGAFFDTGPSGGTRNGGPFDASAPGTPVAPGEDAFVALGIALDGPGPALAEGATVRYRTESGAIAEVTTAVALEIVAAGTAC